MYQLREHTDADGWLQVGFARREAQLARHAFDAWRASAGWYRRWRGRHARAEQQGLAEFRAEQEEHAVGDWPAYLFETEPDRHLR